MEPRLGHDLGAVRVHTDDAAAESARAVSAIIKIPNVQCGEKRMPLILHALVHRALEAADIHSSKSHPSS